MPFIQKDISLKSLNTFGIEAHCKFYVEINRIEDFEELIHTKEYQVNAKLILGGGSNILFTQNFDGIVIKNNLLGIEVVGSTNEAILVKVAAGENWHHFVMWSLENNFYGIENLSLIPGCVGASPMQNIGAYGVEIKDVFESLEALSIKDAKQKVFTKQECEFGYRESVFKNKFKNQYFISSVTFKLSKNSKLNTSYGAINAELQKENISHPNAKDVSNAVIKIRESKLPNPKLMGNAGSFFKNPEVEAPIFQNLKNSFHELVAYPLQNGNYKLAAGWLIEQTGLKGFELNGAAVHNLQALVLVNKNNANGNSVFELSKLVIEKVKNKFGVSLEREVNIV